MEKMNKRKAKDILQFIEDRGLSFEIVLGNQGEEKVMVYSNDGYDGRRIHYAIYPITSTKSKMALGFSPIATQHHRLARQDTFLRSLQFWGYSKIHSLITSGNPRSLSS
jgi:hypothetical protein